MHKVRCHRTICNAVRFTAAADLAARGRAGLDHCREQRVGCGRLEREVHRGWGLWNVGLTLRLHGQLYLPELQLYYYKARMYSPKAGRFLQPDPIGYEGGRRRWREAPEGHRKVSISHP